MEFPGKEKEEENSGKKEGGVDSQIERKQEMQHERKVKRHKAKCKLILMIQCKLQELMVQA